MINRIVYLIFTFFYSSMLLGQLNWPLPSFSSQHTVTGTIGEFRPYSVTDGNPCRFHRGVDMTNGANLNVYAIETGTVNIDAASGKNAQITINGSHNLVYIHVIAVPGVESDEIIFAGDLLGVMYTDGAGSWAEHCHLQESANNLLSSDLFPFIDLHSVTIENISFFTDGLIYTTNASTPFTENTLFPEGEFITLYNKIDILADIADKRVAPDGSSAGGATAPYSISYSIYNLGGELVSTVFNNYKFNSFPDNTEAIYAFGANSNDHNFEYIITNNPFSLPWDRYWNSNQRLDFPESTWPKDNSHDARLAAEAKYLDGKYLIEVNTSDIDYDLTGNNTVETVNILIDNFRPFIEKVQMMAGLDIVYNANWTWDGTTLNFNPSIGAINGTAPINVQVTSSEPLLSLNLSIPELGILSEGMNAVPGNNNMLWEFPLIESDFVAAVDGEYYQIVLEGFDYANNNLEINPANIPIRQIDGTWSPAPISGSDANHQFLFSGDGGVVLPTSFISNYQYWFDDNYLDNVTGSTVEVGEFNFNQAVDVSMLSNGMHSFHIRFKDNNSLWSSVLSQVFVKTQTGLADNVINGGEYWFDDNYAGHNDLVGINAASFNFIDNIDVYSLTNGLHSFHIRFKDANNLWSSVLTQFFVKVPQITTPNLISTYEYWYDSDTYASAISVTLPTPINPYYLNDVVDVSALTEASHTIHFRFQDINGLWSSVVTDTFTREPLILADFTVSPISICAGASVTFDNLSQGATSYLWDFGDGTTSTAPEPTHTYSLGGSYSVTLTASNIDEGLSDILTISNSITVIEPNPLVTASGPTTFCTGSTVTLSTATGFTTYQWYKGAALIPGATSSNYTTNKSGSYKVTVTQGTCSATSAVSVVTVNALPNATVTNQDATNDLCFDASIKLKANGGGGLTYQWYKNGSLLAGATTQNYNAITSGNYKVKVTAPTGCNKTSTPFAIIKTCKEEGDLEAVTQLTVFPNPNDGKYTLVFNSECNSDLLITIYDAVGRVVLEDAGKIEDNLFSKNYDLAGYAKGSYLVMVVCDEGAHYVKVIAQ